MVTVDWKFPEVKSVGAGFSAGEKWLFAILIAATCAAAEKCQDAEKTRKK